ncbi:NAD(P)H-nitrite reductase (plasmid) [Methylophaga frappieri]|jgi:NAD(P)H-nitrite reductase large subunit|uniref:NAD(P)H-nitrite reductase n=1 Tax=Methylophaga frappieri (strain ATCC BAA-2434 / DSM 25690 / JAM7) TaxID=754477 RepID=I1YLP7_METFJ|nr:(2Fe-2S)-binding protein [Methylophaga frappieri]AFJ03840.1 NAD(P)H-nitrite reductase [Methylophaga frappieri]
MSNNNNASDRTDEVICDCSGTTRGKIISLVEQGIVDTDTISRKTGAISGCGSCEYDIENLLDELVLK